jgi:hypothetical protein
VLTVPVEVVIVPQKSSANFTISTQKVATPTVITVSALLAGYTRTATIRITPPPVAEVSLSQDTVIGGSSVVGLVILDGRAGSSGAKVFLMSDRGYFPATVPESIQIAGGSSQGTFTIATKSPVAVTRVTLTAMTDTAYSEMTKWKHAFLTVKPSTSSCDPGQITHSNGMGVGYCDAAPLGTPGNQNTYTVTMATKARDVTTGFSSTPGFATQCLTGIGTVPAGQEPSGDAVQAVQAKQGTNSCATWAYTGNNAGHVHLNSQSQTCLCPTTTDPTWN